MKFPPQTPSFKRSRADTRRQQPAEEPERQEHRGNRQVHGAEETRGQ